MRRPSFDLKHYGEEPEFKAPPSSIELMNAYNWYNYNHDNEDAKKFVVEFLKSKKVSKTVLKKIDQLPSIKLRSIGWQCRILTRGGVLADSKDMLERLHKLIETVKLPDEKEEKLVPVISIQERIQNKATELIADLEDEVDTFILTGTNDFDIKAWFAKNEVKAQVAKRIKEYYEPIYAEIYDNRKATDSEIKEAYSHWKKSELKSYMNFLKEIVSIAESISSAVKTSPRKARKKKVKPAAVLVSKMKFKKKNEKIESAPPADIIGSSQIWVFNDKSKVLTVFNALGEGMSVKGSTITGFDDKTSVSKTLRKPDVVIPQIGNAGKVVLRNLMATIKTKEKPAKGRINTDTLIVRIIK
jgi:hypothetical protein